MFTSPRSHSLCPACELRLGFSYVFIENTSVSDRVAPAGGQLSRKLPLWRLFRKFTQQPSL